MKLDPIKSATEAMTLSQEKNDLFYHRAYLIQKWLAMISINTLAQYAARPRTYPQMQAGQALHALGDVFGHVPDSKVGYLASAVLRFSSTDHPFAPLLRQAHDLLVSELRHPASSRKVCVAYQVAECLLMRNETATQNSDCTPEEEKRVAAHFWELIRRWCAWLDCVSHYQAHALFTIAPAFLNPANSRFDPAIITADMDYLFQKIRQSENGWIWHYRYPESKDGAISLAGSRSNRKQEGAYPLVCNDPWPLRELDTCLIRLYPLAVRHHWSAEDFLQGLRGVLRDDLYFSANDLRAYCRLSLGLYEPFRKRRSEGQPPPATDLARKLCPPPKAKLGNPPWS